MTHLKIKIGYVDLYVSYYIDGCYWNIKRNYY